MSSPYDQNPRPPGPARTFIRNNWLALTGITVFIGTVGFPLVAVVRNNETEYQATGDVGALFGHPFERIAHTLGLSKVNVTSLHAPSAQYAAFIANFPNLKLDPKDPPDIRAQKIAAINAQWKAFADLQIGAANENEVQIRRKLFEVTGDTRTLKDDPRTPGVGYRPTADDIKRIYPGDFDELSPDDWDQILPKAGQPAARQLAAADALASAAHARRQAIAETYVNQEVTAEVRVDAYKRDYATHIHLGELASPSQPLTFYPVQRTDNPPADMPHTNPFSQKTMVTEGIDADDVFRAPPEHLHPNDRVAPMYLVDGALATFKSYAIIWDRFEWGFVPLDQYRLAGLPDRETPSGKPTEGRAQ